MYHKLTVSYRNIDSEMSNWILCVSSYTAVQTSPPTEIQIQSQIQRHCMTENLTS